MSFTPHHMNATEDDFKGNGLKGRYLILPGSDGRAQQIAGKLSNVTVKNHPRCHNLYLGTWLGGQKPLDIGVISTGMGAPSIDIILHELFGLGAKTFIRVGTAGSMQPHRIKAGQIVIPTGCVRDESTTGRFVPEGFPALPSRAFLSAAETVCKNKNQVSFGICHSKDSLYAREFGSGPQKEQNKAYMKILEDAGVLASEMEASTLFTLGTLFDHQKQLTSGERLIFGAILAVIGDSTPFADKNIESKTTDKAIELAFEIISELDRSQP
jgi:uridine phosphorylase